MALYFGWRFPYLNAWRISDVIHGVDFINCLDVNTSPWYRANKLIGYNEIIWVSVGNKTGRIFFFYVHVGSWMCVAYNFKTIRERTAINRLSKQIEISYSYTFVRFIKRPPVFTETYEKKNQQQFSWTWNRLW